jgi:thiamine biosynthesis lipoprotein
MPNYHVNRSLTSVPPESAPPRRWVLIQRTGRPMATEVDVQIAATPRQEAAAEVAADACMAWLDEVDQRLSRFKPESELSRLNASAGNWFACSDLLFEAVTVALQAARASGGLFDPTLLRLLAALGYDRDFALIAHRELAPGDSPLETAGTPAREAAWRGIECDYGRRRIRLPAGAQLDLGGIAKGWAADVALNRFCGAFPGALVNVGGDLRLRGGPATGTAWSIGIRDPRAEAERTDPTSTAPVMDVATITFSRGGLATSGAVRRWWRRGGRRAHHLLDPRTGQPIPLWIDTSDCLPSADGRTASPPPRLIATATALAPTAARAEVAAKLALLRGFPDALRAVEAAWERYGAVGPAADIDAGIALVLTFGSGEVAMSHNTAAYLASWATDGAPLPLRVPSPKATFGGRLSDRLATVTCHPSSEK